MRSATARRSSLGKAKMAVSSGSGGKVVSSSSDSCGARSCGSAGAAASSAPASITMIRVGFRMAPPGGGGRLERAARQPQDVALLRRRGMRETPQGGGQKRLKDDPGQSGRLSEEDEQIWRLV